MNIYKEELLDHYNNPRNFGCLQKPDLVSGEYNPSCGDNIEIQIKIQNDKIYQIGFTGKGCIISQATASMLTQICINKFLCELSELKSNDIISLIGLNLGPTRMKCALLSLDALQKCIAQYQSQQG